MGELRGRTISVVVLASLLVSILIWASEVRPVIASAVIYIKSDGSVDPSTAPIKRSESLYTLTGDIGSSADGIMISRDNVTLDGAGYSLQGSGSGVGINLWQSSNITIRKIKIKGFELGVSITVLSSYNDICESDITGQSVCGIAVWDSYGNSFSRNNITDCREAGIRAQNCSNNSVSGNNMTGNGVAIDLMRSTGNNISNNIIAANGIGVLLAFHSSSNTVFDNNIMANVVGIEVSTSDNSISGNNITANNDFGLNLHGSSNNTICRNRIMANNGFGIRMGPSTNESISENNIETNRLYGINLVNSSLVSIRENNITANGWCGILLAQYSSGNSILNNSVAANRWEGIRLQDYCSSNLICKNNIVNNRDGIWLANSSSNAFCHNTVLNNTNQAYAESCVNAWDNGYPSGGNYWSDYNGTDLSRGAYQNETGSDGIGDVSYVVCEDNTDHFPLKKPLVKGFLETDLNTDGTVNILDIFAVAMAFGSMPEDENWNAEVDLDKNGVINILDVFAVARDYGKTV